MMLTSLNYLWLILSTLEKRFGVVVGFFFTAGRWTSLATDSVRPANAKRSVKFAVSHALVAKDRSLMCRVMTRLFAGAGDAVIALADGVKALKAIMTTKTKFTMEKFIIMPLLMFGQDGWFEQVKVRSFGDDSHVSFANTNRRETLRKVMCFANKRLSDAQQKITMILFWPLKKTV